MLGFRSHQNIQSSRISNRTGQKPEPKRYFRPNHQINIPNHIKECQCDQQNKQNDRKRYRYERPKRQLILCSTRNPTIPPSHHEKKTSH